MVSLIFFKLEKIGEEKGSFDQIIHTICFVTMMLVRIWKEQVKGYLDKWVNFVSE